MVTMDTMVDAASKLNQRKLKESPTEKVSHFPSCTIMSRPGVVLAINLLKSCRNVHEIS